VKVVGPALYGRPVDSVTAVNIADYLTANCTSGPSIPAPNLTYYINGMESVSIYKKNLVKHFLMIELRVL